MKLAQAVQLEHILNYLSVGVAILDATNLRVLYINPYLHTLLEKSWQQREITEQRLEDILPEAVYQLALPLLQQVVLTGKGIRHQEVPYEGFLEARGRTYWEICIERPAAPPTHAAPHRGQVQENTLLITVEDVTDTVRSRLHLHAIHHISSAIAGAYALPEVLKRILQSVQEMVGSTRCAILLIDHSVSGVDTPSIAGEQDTESIANKPLTVTMAVQKGVHPSYHNWHPQVSDQILLGRVARERKAIIISNTSAYPELELPFLDDEGELRRPGSVLCVPIYEPSPTGEGSNSSFNRRTGVAERTKSISGTIEVYHRRSRDFPLEEVQLLERFAQQAGLAIENARLFRRIDQWARVANRSAQQRKNVMLAIPDGVVIYGPRWSVVETNHAARRLLGWTDDIIGLPITEAMARSTATFHMNVMDAPDPIAELERRAEEGQSDEFKIVGADGKAYTMRCSYTPISDELGNTFAYIVIYHDVTKEVAARQRIEAEVKARTAELAQRNLALQFAQIAQEMERTRLELLLERLPSGVILASAEDNTIIVINQHAVQFLQRMGLALEPYDDITVAAKRSVGQQYEPLLRQITTYGVAGTSISYEESPLFLALHKGEATEAELHMPDRDGQDMYLLVSAAPLRNTEGIITSAVLVLHEITHLKTLERAREDFFTTMAHELKTPLANIRVHLSALLTKDLEWPLEEQQDFLRTADEQVERLVDMINRFLDASRVEAGALRLETEPILLPEMAEDLQERLEALIGSSKRQLEITLPSHLPAVMADYELIMSVLTNLLSNAFRYAPEGDVVRLNVELKANGDKQATDVLIQVIDRGPGLSTERQKELFTRFSTFAAMSRPAVDRPGQPTPERRRAGGRWSPATGLGLYISRGIIEAHGSTLTLTSSPGQGATFAFSLPIAEGKSDHDDH